MESIIWDDDNRPTTLPPTTESTQSHAGTMKPIRNATEDSILEEEASSPGLYGDPRNFMLTLPFDPVNVPLQPSEDNSVLPGMSLYESYLQNIARAKTSTTQDPALVEQQRSNLELAWMRKYGNALMMMPSQGKNFETFNDYAN